MISLRGFQAPRRSENLKRQRSLSPPTASVSSQQHNTAVSVFLQALQPHVRPTGDATAPHAAMERNPTSPTTSEMTGNASTDLVQEHQPSNQAESLVPEEPLLFEEEDTDRLAQEVEEECRMSEDLPYTPCGGLRSYVHSSQPASEASEERSVPPPSCDDFGEALQTGPADTTAPSPAGAAGSRNRRTTFTLGGGGGSNVVAAAAASVVASPHGASASSLLPSPMTEEQPPTLSQRRRPKRTRFVLGGMPTAPAITATTAVEAVEPSPSAPLALRSSSKGYSPRASPPSPRGDQWYGLPADVGTFYRSRRGISQLYPWQHEVLSRDDVCRGDNFVYSLPTSGGKTLVAEIALLRCVLNTVRSACFVLPFVSLAEEKTTGLKPFGEAFGFTVDGHYGTMGRFPLSPAPALYVCTIEKANSVLNHMLEEGRGQELGVVVVDELHMLGEPRRGATLELFLSKLLMLRDSHLVQIIGMSATVPNLPVIASWLGAACYEGTYRPVPLRQFSVVDGQVLEDGTTNVRSLASGARSDAEQLFELVTEEPEASVIVFCASRQQCVDTAIGLVRYLQRTATACTEGPPPPHDGIANASTAGRPLPVLGSLSPRATMSLKVLADELQGMSHGDASLLMEVVPWGVAFHHGGLLAEERELIEGAYRAKQLRVLCCTSTLAAGVNLPARRVVFKTPYVGREFLTKARYLQMCGRAGRAGLDTHGESFLILSRRDRDRGRLLMQQPPELCLSQMLEDASHLSRSLLECISVGLVPHEDAVGLWAERLFAWWGMGPLDTPLLALWKGAYRRLQEAEDEAPPSAVEESEVPLPSDCAAQVLHVLLKEALHNLHVQELVSMSPAVTTCDMTTPEGPTNGGRRLNASPFGVSSVRSCFTVEEALLVREELQRLQETGLILGDDLHLCYFLTPLREVGDCDWALFRQLLSRLSDGRQRIADLIGVNEYFVDQRAMGLGGPPHAVPPTDEGRRDFFVARRFFVAMTLADILAEVPRAVVEQRYGVPRGQLQNLMRSASMFSSSITSFCHAMEWYALEAVLASFVKRLGFGVRPDLLPLMEMRGVQPARARVLWNAALRTPAAIAACDPDEMVHRVKAMNPADCKGAKFFTKRSALVLIRESNLLLQHQISEKRGELRQLTTVTSTK